jgi:hypothetical protein
MIPAFTVRQWSFLFMLLASAANAQKTYKEIPILCYHHIKEDTSGKSPDYTIGLHAFAAHLKMLADSFFRSRSSAIATQRGVRHPAVQYDRVALWSLQ